MIIKPKFRGFICTTAHPAGCEKNVLGQIDYVKRKGYFSGAKNALIIGASTGYGLASRIALAFGSSANTLGVFYERPASGSRTATAGWYNTAAFKKYAEKEGLWSGNINGDAFSDGVKNDAINMIKSSMPGGKIDLVVYSLAAPRRTHPQTGEIYNSVLKPIGKDYSGKTVDFHTGVVCDVLIGQATEKEIKDTIAVMGGEDWLMWMAALKEAGVLAQGAITLAYSYIGPEITHPIYRDGTIGKAKDHLESTVADIDKLLHDLGGKAYVSVNKGLVTQASSAIPVVPLYISLLYKVMKEKGNHEGCIEQMYRLFREKLYAADGRVPVDEKGRIRMDEYELDPEVQDEINWIWPRISSENIFELTDLEGYRKEFFRLFGFERDDVDYDAEVDAEVGI